MKGDTFILEKNFLFYDNPYLHAMTTPEWLSDFLDQVLGSFINFTLARLSRPFHDL